MPRKYVVKDQTIYGLYGKNTLPVFIGTSQECKETTLIKFKVVAWMPMPKAYKEQDND